MITSPEKRRLQRQRERCAKRLKSKEEELESSDPWNRVLPIINFDCHEAIASQQKQQDLEDFNELDFN